MLMEILTKYGHIFVSGNKRHFLVHSFYIDLSTWQIKFAISMIFVISFDTRQVLIINIVNSLRMFYQFEDP